MCVMALNLDILNLESFLFLKTVREEMALRRNVCLLSQEERIRAVKTDGNMYSKSMPSTKPSNIALMTMLNE